MNNKSNWKLAAIIAAGVIAVILICIFGIQAAQNKAYSLEEQVNTASSDIKVQEKRRVDLVYNLADCVVQYDKHEAETLKAEVLLVILRTSPLLLQPCPKPIRN